MCGVFGFVSHENGRPDLRALERIALATETRGQHAYGFVWIDGRGRVKCFKQTGRIRHHLGLLAMARDARMLVGHCRYATQGDPADNINNHPHPADGGWIVHNGVIRDYAGLVERFDLHPVSDCDSEVLGLLVEAVRGSVFDRCRAAVRAAAPAGEPGTLFGAPQPLVLLGLWPRPDRLVAVRQGNPLHIAKTKHGYYLASLADGLPGVVKEVADDSALELTGKGITHVSF